MANNPFTDPTSYVAYRLARDRDLDPRRPRRGGAMRVAGAAIAGVTILILFLIAVAL